jgi:hypothetical protein
MRSMHSPVLRCCAAFRALARAACCLLLTAVIGCDGAADAAGFCTDLQRVGTLPEALDEASGIAASRQHPGTLWVHNDSERSPSLYAIDLTGALLAGVDVPGAGRQIDWEDIAVGPCPQGECLYVGDIGDNQHERDDVAILRFPEPGVRGSPVHVVERFPFRYPDGPRDAEALFVMPDTTVYIITKGRSGPIALYRYPKPFREGEQVELVLVQRFTQGLVQLPDLVTGAAATPDGSIVIVRTYAWLHIYSFDGDTLARLLPGRAQDLAALAEPQGEGVEMLADGTVYLVSEVGPDKRSAPLSRLRCRLP